MGWERAGPCRRGITAQIRVILRLSDWKVILKLATFRWKKSAPSLRLAGNTWSTKTDVPAQRVNFTLYGTTALKSYKANSQSLYIYIYLAVKCYLYYYLNKFCIATFYLVVKIKERRC